MISHVIDPIHLLFYLFKLKYSANLKVVDQLRLKYLDRHTFGKLKNFRGSMRI